MSTIPSLTRLLEETESIPNAVLEASYREIGLYNGIRRYGIVKEIPEIIEIEEEGNKVTIPFRKEVLSYIRGAINSRNLNGDYYFTSRTERKRLHRVNLNPKW